MTENNSQLSFLLTFIKVKGLSFSYNCFVTNAIYKIVAMGKWLKVQLGSVFTYGKTRNRDRCKSAPEQFLR